MPVPGVGQVGEGLQNTWGLDEEDNEEDEEDSGEEQEEKMTKMEVEHDKKKEKSRGGYCFFFFFVNLNWVRDRREKSSNTQSCLKRAPSKSDALGLNFMCIF